MPAFGQLLLAPAVGFWGPFWPPGGSSLGSPSPSPYYYPSPTLTVMYCTVKYSAIWYITVQCNTTQYMEVKL